MNIQQIKQQVTIQKVLSRYNLEPDRNNRLCCPWHKDTTPSLQIYPKTGTWTCFSSNCNAGSGDVIDFVMKYENISKFQAMQICAEIGGIPVQTLPIAPTKTPITKPIAVATILLPNRIETLQKAYTYFQSGLASSHCKPAEDYLQSRKLNRFTLDIGYNSGQFHRNELKEYITSFCELGLLTPKTNGSHSIFAKDCIIFPLKNNQNYIVSIYGRSILQTSLSKHFYLKDSQGLYPHYPPVQTKKLLIAECIIDTATLLQEKENSNVLGKLEFLSAYGTNRLNQEHLEAVENLKELDEIIFFFDGDDAGHKAVHKYSEQLHHLHPHITISKVQTPNSYDINSMYVTYGLESIETLIQERIPLYKASQEQSASQKIQSDDIPVLKLNTHNHEALLYETTDLLITVLGGIKLTGLERLRATLKIMAKAGYLNPIRQNLDLYNTEQVTSLVRYVNEELDVKTETIRSAIHALINELETYRIARVTQLQPHIELLTPLTAKALTITENYLRSPQLMARTMEDLGKTGIVGEIENRLIMYLVFMSRVTQEPLHIISFGTSGSGKTHLQEKISRLLPETHKLEITSLSGNALYYLQEHELKHKVILIEDMYGAQEVLYPLRELQSKQRITKTVSVKNKQGIIKTITYVVSGPVCVSGCTTKSSMYEDNSNRSIHIYIDGSYEQDQRIMDYQRKESAGIINKEEEQEYQELFTNIQQIIQPIQVINPFATELQLPSRVFKKRRSNKIYLRFIETITLFHQFQRERKIDASGKEYIETTLEDIAWANKLLKGVLLRKSDELSEPARNFFEYLKTWLQKEAKESFTTKDIRDGLLTTSSLKRHLPELINYGLIKITSGNKVRGYVYEICNYEEFQNLRLNIDHYLDDLLQTLQKKYSQ